MAAYNPDYDPFQSMGGGVKTAQGGWIPKAMQGQAGAPPAAQAPGVTSQAQPITSQQQVGSTSATVGAQPAQGQPTTVAGSFQQALINKLNPQAVSASNPQIAPAIQANQLSEQRNFENQRALLAERAAATGTNNSGGFETSLQGLAQDRAAREGQFAGNAVMHLGDQQNQNLMQALGMAGGLLSGNATLQQQKELADLEAQLKQKGIDLQSVLGQGDLAVRNRSLDVQQLLGLLGLQQSGNQFNQSLAQNASQFGQSLDQSGLLGLLGML